MSRVFAPALLLLTAATACSTPRYDARDREGRGAVHLVAPAVGDFRTSAELPGSTNGEEFTEESDLGEGLGIVFEWGLGSSRTLTASSYTFGLRNYILEATDRSGATERGEMLEFSVGYRAYPDLGVENPLVQPFVGADFLLLPFVDIGEVDFLGLGAALSFGVDIWLADNAAFEIETRVVGAAEDLLQDARFHRGYLVEAGIVVWL